MGSLHDPPVEVPLETVREAGMLRQFWSVPTSSATYVKIVLPHTPADVEVRAISHGRVGFEVQSPEAQGKNPEEDFDMRVTGNEAGGLMFFLAAKPPPGRWLLDPYLF